MFSRGASAGSFADDAARHFSSFADEAAAIRLHAMSSRRLAQNSDVVAMAMSRPKAIERLSRSSGNILEHLQKIADNPGSQSINHWLTEIRNWINIMEHAAPHAGRQTGSAWSQLISAYTHILDDLP